LIIFIIFLFLGVTFIIIFTGFLLYQKLNKIFGILLILIGIIFLIFSIIKFKKLYLIKNNILLDFLDYAVYGIKTFENKVSYIRLIKSGNIFIVVLSILIPITIIYSIIKLIKCKNKTEYANNMYICLIYGISSFLGIYPIADKFHFLYSSIILMILLIYIINMKN